ncbi:MAG: hypothetical protein KAJ93_08650 [Methanosarcinales archaeon]|nr:hypothetical protein [Methanosarcinales archaeon]
MAKTKKFKGLVRIVPTTLLNAQMKDGPHTARVNDPIDLMKKKGLIVLRISPEDKTIFNSWVDTVAALPGYPSSLLDIEVKIRGKARTLPQNALYWALVTILALEVYMENGWEDVIHEEMLEIYAPKIVSKLHKTSVPKRSKDMDTTEFTRLIEGVLHELSEHGVSITDPSDMDQYWKNYAKIRFSGGKDHGYREGESLPDYAKRVNYCEACRKYLRPGSFGYDGNLAHIVSRGTGGEDATWNIIHLCAKHHLSVQHQKGWEYFLKQFPHLQGKYDLAHENHNIIRGGQSD